jgi:hypothetical protein
VNKNPKKTDKTDAKTDKTDAPASFPTKKPTQPFLGSARTLACRSMRPRVEPQFSSIPVETGRWPVSTAAQQNNFFLRGPLKTGKTRYKPLPGPFSTPKKHEKHPRKPNQTSGPPFLNYYF